MRHGGFVAAALSAICCLLVCWAAARAAAEKDNDDARPGLSLRIAIEGEFSIGDEIPVTFTIKNGGPRDYEYYDRDYDRSGRMDEYELVAVDEQRQTVRDPRADWPGGMGGGLCRKATLAPGQSFTKTIALNRWALLTRPGTCQVTGYYRPEGGPVVKAVESMPVSVTIRPRTDGEMGACIEKLAAELTAADDDASAGIVQKLMYTCDARVVPAIIDEMYRDRPSSFWCTEGLLYYLPKDDAATAPLLKAASERGLAGGMQWILEQRGVTPDQFKPLIEASLAPERPGCWQEGALAAQRFCDDRFTARLIAIATDKDSKARTQAIHALAMNRTDESVATLKKLLDEPDPPKPMGRTIRQVTTDAIRSAYSRRGNTPGRPLRKDDFPARLQQPEPPPPKPDDST